MDNVAVVSQFRKLDWTQANQGVGDVQHGNTRLGKEIAAKVLGAADLPDELKISLPVYQQSGERDEYVIRCAVEIDTMNQVFQLLPMPDEIERVLDLAQASIHDRLLTALQPKTVGNAVTEVEPVPVYYGTP